jgi:anti-sigma28 factor (negative regulator of flagellin synthesis)
MRRASGGTVTIKGEHLKIQTCPGEPVEIAAAAEIADWEPEVRQARVVQLREQVRAGSYQVPIEALAWRIFVQVRDLQHAG